MSESDSSSRSSSSSSNNTDHEQDDDDGVVVEPDCYIYNDGDDGDDGDASLELTDTGMIGAGAAAADTTMDRWLDDQLQASIFYEEPVRHITFHTLFVSDGGDLERMESRIVELTEPNVVDRFVVGGIVKQARLTAGGVVGYRLNSMFVYNVHVSLAQLSKYACRPDAFSFVAELMSLNSNIIIKPTLACFHSLNSVHVVLRRLPQTTTTTRLVSITSDALSSSSSSVRRYTRRRTTE